MVATKGHVCREPGQINYGQAPPFISTNMGSWRTPLNSNRDGFSVYPQFTAASCCIQRGPRSSKLMCTLRGKSKGGGVPLEIFQLHGVPPLRGWVCFRCERWYMQYKKGHGSHKVEYGWKLGIPIRWPCWWRKWPLTIKFAGTLCSDNHMWVMIRKKQEQSWIGRNGPVVMWISDSPMPGATKESIWRNVNRTGKAPVYQFGMS